MVKHLIKGKYPLTLLSKYHSDLQTHTSPSHHYRRLKHRQTLIAVLLLLALYHNLNNLRSWCKGTKLYLGAQYDFHRTLTTLTHHKEHSEVKLQRILRYSLVVI